MAEVNYGHLHGILSALTRFRDDLAELAEYQAAGKVAVIDLKLLDQVKVAGNWYRSVALSPTMSCA